MSKACTHTQESARVPFESQRSPVHRGPRTSTVQCLRDTAWGHTRPGRHTSAHTDRSQDGGRGAQCPEHSPYAADSVSSHILHGYKHTHTVKPYKPYLLYHIWYARPLNDQHDQTLLLNLFHTQSTPCLLSSDWQFRLLSSKISFSVIVQTSSFSSRFTCLSAVKSWLIFSKRKNNFSNIYRWTLTGLRQLRLFDSFESRIIF